MSSELRHQTDQDRLRTTRGTEIPTIFPVLERERELYRAEGSALSCSYILEFPPGLPGLQSIYCIAEYTELGHL